MEKQIEYEHSERTGIESIDSEINRLRAKRDHLYDEQMSIQKEIDELFLKSMSPDIERGDYIRFMKDDKTIEGKVSGIRRVFGGVTIEFDIVAYIPWADEYDNLNNEITFVHCSAYHESISIKKEDLCRITKINREQFIGSVRNTFEELINATRELEPDNQLELDF